MKRLPELIFKKSREGKVGYSFGPPDVPEVPVAISDSKLRKGIAHFPQLSEVEIVRHYTALSHLNHSVDSGFYPLGSCTMKYNPKINERVAGFKEFNTHPYMPHDMVQGNLEIIHTLEQCLVQLTGMAGFTMSPAAGAHGEFTGIMVIRQYLISQGNPRQIILIPDSAHGTNPSSAHMAGYEIRQIPSNHEGIIDVDTLKANLTPEVAALMMTNPNTLGIFEKNMSRLAEVLHENGSLLYMDGANLNALLGIIKPGDKGVDVLHLNLHKTFATPHGGGGPGSGPVGVVSRLLPFLPLPRIQKKGDHFEVIYHGSQSIGRIKNFYGQFLVMIKALAYLLALGREHIVRVAEDAVLNANYVRKQLEGLLDLPYDTPTLHEVVFSDKNLPVKTIDIAKRLLDHGIHPFTVYFPLIVHGAMMIEPTETESKETLDQFVTAMKSIIAEAQTNPEMVKGAPYHTPVRRLDETLAARKPILKWTKENEEEEA